jgi:hypothetical protein
MQTFKPGTIDDGSWYTAEVRTSEILEVWSDNNCIDIACDLLVSRYSNRPELSTRTLRAE